MVKLNFIDVLSIFLSLFNLTNSPTDDIDEFKLYCPSDSEIAALEENVSNVKLNGTIKLLDDYKGNDFEVLKSKRVKITGFIDPDDDGQYVESSIYPCLIYAKINAEGKRKAYIVMSDCYMDVGDDFMNVCHLGKYQFACIGGFAQPLYFSEAVVNEVQEFGQ